MIVAIGVTLLLIAALWVQPFVDCSSWGEAPTSLAMRGLRPS